MVSLARQGDRRALARLLSSIENGETVLEPEIEESDDMLTLYKKTFSLIPDLTIDALNTGRRARRDALQS